MKKIIFIVLIVVMGSCKNNTEEPVKKDANIDSEIMEPD